jgi:hypothetical protein
MRQFYKAVTENGGGRETTAGGSGLGFSVRDLCGTHFDGIGTLECTGDVTANCRQGVARLGGYTCRTHCDNDDDCKRSNDFFGINGWVIPSQIICA